VASVHVTSATGASSCGSYANTATMTAGNAATLTASATISVQCPVLSISKTADSATVNAGSPVGYTMTASNSSASGTGTATGVSLTDTLPGGSGVSWSIQSQPSGNPCSLSGTTPQSLSCTLGTMAPGASNTVHVTGTTNGATCGLLTNTASLAATNIPAPLTQSAGITIQCPKLSITKTADSASVSAGTGIGYVITASNSSAAGTGTATGAAISDPLPAGTGVTWTIASQPSGNPCTITGSAPNQTLGCILGSVAPGASASIHLTSPTSAASCQSYANTVTLSATNVPTSLTGSASITVNCPHLTLSKTADKVVVNEGGQIGYKLSIGNTGLGSAAGVMLTDHLPAGSGISWSLTPAVSGCAITTGTLTCNLGTVGAGSSLSVHITSPTTQTSCATYPNTATLTASNNATLTGQATLSVACPTTSLYTGTQALVMGNTLTLTARVVGSAACTSTGTVTFTLDRNPLAPGADPFPVTASVSNGVAMGATLSTTGWAAGVYMVTASYSGPAFCQPSHDSATLTVGLAGIAASIGAGGGRYTAPNSTSPYTVLFAFSAGHGTLQLRNAASWQLKGTLTQLVKGPNGNGAASGVGTLLLGTLTISNVAFTMSFHANSAPYTFGIHITYLPTGTQPRLPNAPPVPLTNGAIHLT
jgi:uncharacterized repeat protein (TIGR01451 family)